MTVREADRTGFAFPTSELAVAADALVAEVSSPLVYNHVVRAYLYAREMAAATGLRAGTDYDDELLYLGCILHDLGATDYAQGDQRFEVDGADAAAEFLRARDVAEDRIQVVWNAIALHSTDGIAHRFGTEVALTQMGTGADIIGRGRELLPAGFAERVHAAWPRLDVGYAFGEVLARQVRDNPAKGSPFTFPGQLCQLYYPDQPAVTWFDVVDAAGWHDRPVPIGDRPVGAATPEELATLFTRYFNAGDLDGLLSLYEPGAVLFPMPGERRTGLDAIRESLRGMLDSGARIELTVRGVHVAGELALIANDSVLTGAGPDGTLVSTTTEIARRGSDGSWRYVLDDPYFTA
ncbi:nuclear transport factor 2 family protein [Nocardia farcinica]|uniref:nuclear transport factor 2 family protein n=1 Tax=Nocardia farcinica TaxID=37329 RepID=UPI0018942651|nr:nuclear transport factor 2 family protein [Nocardia farcinica]MBF6230602.1 HD domain-containing protein [Nocardia farcinica]